MAMIKLENLFDDAMKAIDDAMRGVTEFNVAESDLQYDIIVLLPGVNKEDISIDYNGKTFSIVADRKIDETKNFIYQSFKTKKHKISLNLYNIDFSNSKATFENGVLQIEIPKDIKKSKLEIK